jgi:CheY-like chemotaxis protein
MHVAVVDDDRVTLKVVSSFLEREGHEVTTFRSPREALQALREVLPDLLITDLNMPECTGFELIQAVREVVGQSDFPIVVLSRNDERSAFSRSFAVGATDYLRKPICRNELVSKCERLVARDYETVSFQRSSADGGRVLGGQKVLRRLAEGAQGSVFLVEGPSAPRVVKVLRKPTQGAREAELRFLREAYALGQIEHPHVVRLQGFSAFEDSLHCVLEYVEGGCAKTALLEGRTPSERELVGFLYALAGALATLHDAKIVHRDVKLSNVLLRGWQWANPVLIDFGLAKYAWDTGVTRAGDVLGTPGYMAPEILSGHDPSDRADVFSLGVVGCELQLGHHPFPNDRGLALAQRLQEERLPIPAGVSAELGALLHDMTQLTPEARPTAAEVRSGLARLL